MLLEGDVKIVLLVTDEYYEFKHSLSDKEREAVDAFLIGAFDVCVAIIKEMRIELDK